MNSRETDNTNLNDSGFNYDSGSKQNVLAAPARQKMCRLRPWSKEGIYLLPPDATPALGKYPSSDSDSGSEQNIRAPLLSHF